MPADAAAPRTTWHTTMGSVLGELTLVRDDNGVRGLHFPHHRPLPSRAGFGARSTEGFEDTVTELEQYLAGTRRGFDVALAARGDELAHRVWQRVAQIGYGASATYGEIAAQIGDGVSAQQVGGAVARNPLCILVPCHRVLGHDGRLVGYAGGLPRKRHLLELEGARFTIESTSHTSRAVLAGVR